MQGAGSVWNANSWHWEEKNYNKWAHEHLPSILTSLSFTESEWTFTVKEITKITGEASVNIRKGKSILLFEFEVDLNLKATKDSEELDTSVKIQEFNQEDIDDPELEIKVNTSSDSTTQVRTLLSRHAKKHISKALQQFYNDFKQHVSDVKQFEEDKKKREEENKRREEAIQKNFESQQKLLQASNEEEAKKRQAPQATGSVWNYNSYFWEEKSVNWANGRLKELLEEIKVEIPSGEAKVTQVELQGDSSISIRKGKKIVTYSYEAWLDWEGKLMSSSGEIASCTGKVHLPDICPLSEPDYEVEYSLTSEGPGQDRIKQLVQVHATPVIKQQIAKFVKQLNES